MKKLFALAAIPAMILAAGSASAGMWEKTHTGAYEIDNAVLSGAADDAAQVDIAVGLKLRNEKELDGYLARMGTPGDPMFGQSLSHEFVEQNYGPLAADVEAVKEHLRNSGFTNIQAVGQLVTATGSIANAKLAFNTEFAQFDRNGEKLFANTKPAMVPANLKGIVDSVIGLSNAQRSHTFAHVVPFATSGINPANFAKAYGVTSTTPKGSNTVVGIISDGNMTGPQTDLKTFESKNGITPATVKVEGPGGTDTSGTVEWDLDSQDIIGMSGGVKTLIFYAAASLSDSALATVYNLAVSDNTAKAINVSLGECERSAKSSGAMASDDAIFKKAAAQGQTFFVSSGDSGYHECGRFRTGQSYPAVSPYVVAVGGTTLSLTSSGTWSSETTWTGGGGGPSVTEAKPSFQNGVAAITGTMRGVPDVAMDANPSSGAIIYVGSKTEQVGGTSLAAPLTSATWARSQSAHGNSLGFAAPLIYSLAEGSKYSTTFHDITSGTNNGESAKAGWDYVTGWGSFKLDAFVSGI